MSRLFYSVTVSNAGARRDDNRSTALLFVVIGGYGAAYR